MHAHLISTRSLDEYSSHLRRAHFAFDLLAGFKAVFIRTVNIFPPDWPVLSVCRRRDIRQTQAQQETTRQEPTTLGIDTMEPPHLI